MKRYDKLVAGYTKASGLDESGQSLVGEAFAADKMGSRRTRTAGGEPILDEIWLILEGRQERQLRKESWKN